MKYLFFSCIITVESCISPVGHHFTLRWGPLHYDIMLRRNTNAEDSNQLFRMTVYSVYVH